MKKLSPIPFDLVDCIGKTVVNYRISPQKDKLLIVFADNSYIQLITDTGGAIKVEKDNICENWGPRCG